METAMPRTPTFIRKAILRSLFLAASALAMTSNAASTIMAPSSRASVFDGGAAPTLLAQDTSLRPADTKPAEQQGAQARSDDTPESRMSHRFPQKVKVGDLIGLPVLDDNDVTLGRVTQVVRSPEGKIKLIVSYSRWFGWFGRPVGVPIEVVAILAKQIASLDMKPPEYDAAPTWSPASGDHPIAWGETIRIALTRR
jgi:hypothetical protein